MQLQWPTEKVSPPSSHHPPVRTTSAIPRTPAELPLPPDSDADMEKFAADNLNLRGKNTGTGHGGENVLNERLK